MSVVELVEAKTFLELRPVACSLRRTRSFGDEMSGSLYASSDSTESGSRDSLVSLSSFTFTIEQEKKEDQGAPRDKGAEQTRSQPKVSQSAKKTGCWTRNRTATTWMLRDIPARFNPESLKDILDQAGFSAKFDFLYVPMDKVRNLCLGYAFINFVTVGDANRFAEAFSGKQLHDQSTKRLRVERSRVQGLVDNVENLTGAPFDSIESASQPMVFKDGKRIEALRHAKDNRKQTRTNRARPSRRGQRGILQ